LSICYYILIPTFTERNLRLKKQAPLSPEKTLQTKKGDIHQADGKELLFKYFGLKYKFHHGTETDIIF